MMKKTISGQSVIEYFVMMAVILAAILSTGVIEHFQGALNNYFDSAVTHLR